MLELKGFTILEKIYASDNSEIYRAQRKHDSQLVILKLLKEEYPSLEKLSRFLHEHEILKLLNGEGTVVVYEIERYKNSFIILQEDGGQNLASYIAEKQRLQLTEAISLAIKITESLDKIHQHHIIHKDINPTNILRDPTTEKIRIIDFGISSTLSKENLEVFSINQLEGTLPYISPEQTGRMNRGIDYRSDYYSLGMTIYQMVTGELPFKSNDNLELVYSHIAKVPISPHDLDSAIPKPLSDIIMKLLAKTSEERYQSCYGLISDLQNCLFQLQKTGTLHDFPLATKDLSGRFQISEKLYGRESEIKFLLDKFTVITENGHSELMLVAGYSGIGKSSLVHEIHKPIVEKRGYFVSGKFDQLKRNIPYAPFVQALEGLIQQFLTESEGSVRAWKEKILMALGPNCGVLSEILPTLSKIIGQQPSVLPLGPTETQNRFIFVFQSFIEAVASHDHPLVIFLDDLQWVDLPSLKLLEALLAKPSINYLFIIGAYRDNEVTSVHPLMLTLESFQKDKINYETLTLQPLQVVHIQELLADTLSKDLEVVEALATICHAKTLGNPFFLNQFLRALCEENLIEFDTSRGIWHWLIDKIRNRKSTENVVDLVISNLQKLSNNACKLLTYAACIGNRFDLQLLSSLQNISPKETATILNEILQEGFVVPLDEAYRFISDNPNSNANYQFIHDRVQQAAYLLLTDDDKEKIHLEIAKTLLEKLSTEKQEEKLFDIVNQFNLGIDLIIKPQEKVELATLNLKAGRKAKSSAAYAVAFNYLQISANLLDENTWTTHYNLALPVYTELAEAAYLSDNFAESERVCDIILTKAHSVLDQVKVYETMIYTEIARNAPAKAVEISIEVLKKLGVKFPKNPRTHHVLLRLIKTKMLLMGKTNERLINLPSTNDAKMVAACNILSAAIAPAYFATPLLFPLFTLALFNLSIRHGYTKGTPASYASYGIILCGILGDIKNGYLFGQLAQQLVDHYHAVELESKISLMVNGFVLHWKDPFRNTLAPLLAAHLRGVETGDLEYSTYSAYFYMVCSFCAGVELTKISDDMRRFHEFAQSHHTHKPVVYSMTVLGQTVENLLGNNDDPSHVVGKYFNEETMIQEAINTNNRYGIYSLYVVKLILNYLFYKYEEAYKASLMVPVYVQSATGAAPIKVFNFYDSLNLLALYDKAAHNKKRHYIKMVSANQKKMKQWMKFSPENCANKYYLVEAELARVQNRVAEAEALYDKAIQYAKQNMFIQELALASELAAIFYLAQGKEMVAKGFIMDAHYSYAKWGAVAKLKHLETTYPMLLDQTQSITTSKSTQLTSSDYLDLASVMKATQTISRQIVLSDLLKQLMSFVIENAGAQKGYLLLEKNNEWVIEASAENNSIIVLQSLSIEKVVPLSVIQYVIHSKDCVLLDNPTQSKQFLSDPYIINKKPKSILSIPLLNQGVLSGILYLENNLMSGTFTKNRVDLLNLLSSQIVISIENARLYTNMTQLNRAYERFIPQEFLLALEKKNITEVRLGDQVQKDMTVMFCNIRNFTSISERLSPGENFAFVNNFLKQLEPVIKQYNGFIDKYIGDSIMAIYPTHTDDALDSAIEMLNILSDYNESHPEQAPIHIGIGLNSGLLMLGIVGGQDHMEGTVISDVVNVASRTERLTKTYHIALLITEDTYKRLRNPDKYAIRKLDNVIPKGKSRSIIIYEVFDNDIESLKFLKIQTKADFEQGVAYFYQNNFIDAEKTFISILRINPSDTASELYLQRCKDAIKNTVKQSDDH